jgi:hypothetical protein
MPLEDSMFMWDTYTKLTTARSVVMNSGGRLLMFRFQRGRKKDYFFLKGFRAVGYILDTKRTPKRHMLSESELNWCYTRYITMHITDRT